MSSPGERTPSDPDRAPDERARRIRLEIPVEIRTGTGSFAGMTKNICAGGVFVAMFRSFSVGERVAVWLRMPGDPEPIEALAEVRWSRPFQELPDRPAGLGLRFLDPPPRIIRVTRYGR